MGESGDVIVLVFEVVVCGSGSLCNFVKQRAGEGGCLCGNGFIVHVHVSENGSSENEVECRAKEPRGQRSS